MGSGGGGGAALRPFMGNPPSRQGLNPGLKSSVLDWQPGWGGWGGGPASVAMDTLSPFALPSSFSFYTEETKDSFLAHVDVPGYASSDLKVDIDFPGIFVSGGHKRGKRAESTSVYLELPEGVGEGDAEKGVVTLSRGVLSLSFHKNKPTPHHIKTLAIEESLPAPPSKPMPFDKVTPLKVADKETPIEAGVDG
jgi:HSP20 family molecular chaperone IbpA